MASRTRDLMYKNGKLFRMLNERMAGLFLDVNTKSLRSDMTFRVREIATQMMKYLSQLSPTATTATREELPVNFSLVICN